MQIYKLIMTIPNYLYKNNTINIKKMKQNIKNNYTKGFDTKLYSANYYDFMLYKGNSVKYDESYINSLVIADFSDLDIKDNRLYSTISWDKSINEGVHLQNIGFTGVDNGLISFKKDRITNKEFLDLYLNSYLDIKSGDTRFFLNPVTGNTMKYDYSMELIENDERYISCKGGFYQGFFKLHGTKYQVLPYKMEEDWTLHFELRPRSDYKTADNIVNNIHENNKGIFFFMGTRAENKFYSFYNNIIDENTQSVVNNDYYIDTNMPCNDYFADTYVDENERITNNLFIENYTDSEGRKLDAFGITEIESDNKFLMFDRTSNGFTTKNWVEGTKVILTDNRNYSNANYFLLMNRTKTGYTASSIDKYNVENKQKYDIYKDIRNNVFALRVTDEGAIGYKYGVYDCDNENKYELIEEYSKNGLINKNEWNDINIKCSKTADNNMKLYFYVNGYLIFISKDLIPFNFKALNDVPEKQEGVAYNISLGGGSLGLLEAILPDYYTELKQILPIEKDFCGTFIGDIKSFKMYEGFIDYSSIKNYL